MIIEKRRNFIINVIYFTLIMVMVYITLKYAIGLIMPFIIGYIVALIVKPLINFTTKRMNPKKLHIYKKIIAVFFVLLFHSVVGFLIFLLITKLFIASKDAIIKLPEIYALNVEPVIYKIFNDIEGIVSGMDPLLVQTIKDTAISFSNSIATVLSQLSTAIIRFVSSTVSFMPGLFLSIILSIISSFFFAMDYDKIREYFAKTIPLKMQNNLVEIKNNVIITGFKYIKAYVTLSFITFIEVLLGLSLLNVNGAVLIAAIIAVVDILPVLGTGSVVIPWIIIELIKGNLPLAVGLLMLYVIIIVVRNILEPKLVGAQIGLHPLVILICMYVGVNLFGFFGLFLMPFTVVIIKHFYDTGKIHFSDE